MEFLTFKRVDKCGAGEQMHSQPMKTSQEIIQISDDCGEVKSRGVTVEAVYRVPLRLNILESFSLFHLIVSCMIIFVALDHDAIIYQHIDSIRSETLLHVTRMFTAVHSHQESDQFLLFGVVSSDVMQFGVHPI